MIPILAPGIIAVALFGFTLSYDEFARTLQTAGSLNTLPLEIWSMTLNVTSPSLYALGTVTTIMSFVIIGACLGAIVFINKRRGVRAPRTPCHAPPSRAATAIRSSSVTTPSGGESG